MYSNVLMVHQLFALVFILLALLPIVTLIRKKTKSEIKYVRFWRGLIMAANISLLVALITGYLLFPELTSWKTWLAVLLVVALGGHLGIIAKSLKQYKTATDLSSKQKHLGKITYLGFAYIIVLIGILGMMSQWYAL
ncbi:hypothetical protein RZN25_12905 [Bacillaceae bacterium S4-13-56]